MNAQALRLDPLAPALAVAAVCLACIGITIATGGNVAFGLAPVFVAAVLYLVWQIPARSSALVLLFLALALERQGDTLDFYHSPFYPLGLALNAKYSTVTQIQALQFSGLDLLCLWVLLVAVVRSRDEGRNLPLPAPLSRFSLLACAAMLAAFARGMLAHGNASIAVWQLRLLLHLPLFFLVFAVGLRGPTDFRAAGRAVVAAALCRAVYIVYVAKVVQPAVPHRQMGFVSNHDDSMVLAVAMLILLVSLSERYSAFAAVRALLLLPPLVVATTLNARRIVWVDLGGALIIYAVLSGWTPLKRAVARFLVATLPLAILYVAVGWTAQSRIFAPVHTLRSVVSSEADRSTFDRDVENWNLVTTIPQARLIGRGLGHEYVESVRMDDISRYFPAYRSFPHNSVLGIWVFFGLFGFLALWGFHLCAVYLGARAAAYARDPALRTAAFCSVGAIFVYLSQSWGDMGLWSDQGCLLAALAAVVAGKAAIATGAWPSSALAEAAP